MPHEAVEVLGWTLLHFVWQGIAAAVLFAVVMPILRRASAQARYVVACAILGCLAGCPLVTGYLLWPNSPRPSISQPVVVEDRTALPSDQPSGPMVVDTPEVDGVLLVESAPKRVVTSVIPKVSATDIPAPEPPRWNVRLRVQLSPMLPWLVGVWLIGVTLLSLRLLASWLSIQRLRRRATQLAAEPWQAALRQLAKRLRVTRPVKLVETALIEVPAVIGWLRPVILLPATAMTGLTTEQLEALLAHELAHVWRHDYLVNLLQTVIETLLFYHPAVWWISHRIRIEREHCCDDLAVRVCGDNVTYAKALVAMEELRGPAVRLAMSSHGGSLLTRVARLIGVKTQAEIRASWCGGLVLLVAFATAWVLCSAEEPDPEDRDYSITLDNGVTVRLIGVSDLTAADPKPWWRPNGVPLREPLKNRFNNGKGTRWDSIREFHLEIDGLPPYQQAVGYVNGNGSNGGLDFGFDLAHSRGLQLGSTLRAFDGYFPASTQHADVQVRMTDGLCGPWQRITPDGKRDLDSVPAELRELYGRVELKQILDTGRVDLSWKPRLEMDARLEVRVVDVDDVIHRWLGGSSGNIKGGEFGFLVPKNRVKAVEYRLWPWSREVTFQNVSVRPGLRTKVTMSEKRLVAKPAPPPADSRRQYLAVWTARFDARQQDEFLTAINAKRAHELPTGEIFVAKSESMRNAIRQRLAPNAGEAELCDQLHWWQSSNEVTEHWVGSLSVNADPKLGGTASLWGE